MKTYKQYKENVAKQENYLKEYKDLLKEIEENNLAFQRNPEKVSIYKNISVLQKKKEKLEEEIKKIVETLDAFQPKEIYEEYLAGHSHIASKVISYDEKVLKAINSFLKVLSEGEELAGEVGGYCSLARELGQYFPDFSWKTFYSGEVIGEDDVKECFTRIKENLERELDYLRK